MVMLGVAEAFIPKQPTFVNTSLAYELDGGISGDAGLSGFEGASKAVAVAVSKDTRTVSLEQGMSFIYTDSSELAYYVQVVIGTTVFQLLLDTGSPYMWVYDADCTGESCSGKTLYNETDHTVSSTFELSYDSGEASGMVAKDWFSIAGTRSSNFSFGAADTVPDLFANYTFTGVMGLSENSSGAGLTDVVTELYSAGSISSAKFAMVLGNVDAYDGSNGGLIAFGDTSSQLYTEPKYTVEVLEDSTSHWEVEISSVYVNDTKLTFESLKVNGTNTTSHRIGLLDSGTTSIVLNTEDATTVHQQFEDVITDGSQYAILCNSTQVIYMEIGGHNWTLTPTEYLGEEYTGTMEGYCVSNIQGLDSTDDGSWILGNRFLRKYYVELDYGAGEVSLAEKADIYICPGKNETYANSTRVNSTTVTTVRTSTSASASASTSATSSSSSMSVDVAAIPSINPFCILGLLLLI